MKKNLTKLALSGAALAAVAATLGTSTYAWYTTNPTVSANNIIGASSDTGSSSIFISKDSTEKKTWSAKVEFAVSDFKKAKANTDPVEYEGFKSNLIPLQYAGTGTFTATKVDGGKTVADSAAAHTTDVASVRLYFRSSKTETAQKVYLKDINITNTTSKLPVYDNLLYGQDVKDSSNQTIDVGVAKTSATYAVDFVNALSLAVYNADATNGYDKAMSLKPLTARNNYSSPSTDAAQTINTSTAKAQEYFDAVMENDLDGVKSVAGAYDKAAIATLPTDGVAYSTVDFFIYLDGASEWCYDACQGQTFTVNLTFTSDKDSAWNNA